MREIGHGYSYCESILILQADKNGVRGHIKWVPPTISREILELVIKDLAKPGEGYTLLPVGKGDRWAVDFHPATSLEEVPHFLDINIGGESHTILLQLNGRRIVCPLCGTNKHLPHACRSPLIRERDNIHVNDEGDYEERKEEEKSKDQPALTTTINNKELDVERNSYDSDSATVTTDGEQEEEEDVTSEEDDEFLTEDDTIPDTENKIVDWTKVEGRKRNQPKKEGKADLASTPTTPEIKKSNKRKPTHSNSPPHSKQNKNTHKTK